MGVELGTAVLELNPSPKEQRRSRIRVRLKAIRTGRLVCSEQRVKGAGLGDTAIQTARKLAEGP
jgi:hypothetical protein